MSSNFTTFHVFSEDDLDRAKISSMLYSFGHHVEIYSELEEFLTLNPARGLIFVRETNNGEALKITSVLKDKKVILPVIAYCGKYDPYIIISGMKVGVFDYLLEQPDLQNFQKRLSQAIEESEESMKIKLKHFENKSLLERLSKRENHVLTLLSEGLTEKEIAKIFGISPRTIEIHKQNIHKKLSVNTTIQAIILKYKTTIGSDII
jgi:two-component system response regulator FixJ